MANDTKAAAGLYKQTLLAGLWRDSRLPRLLRKGRKRQLENLLLLIRGRYEKKKY